MAKNMSVNMVVRILFVKLYMFIIRELLKTLFKSSLLEAISDNAAMYNFKIIYISVFKKCP